MDLGHGVVVMGVKAPTANASSRANASDFETGWTPDAMPNARVEPCREAASV